MGAICSGCSDQPPEEAATSWSDPSRPSVEPQQEEKVWQTHPSEGHHTAVESTAAVNKRGVSFGELQDSPQPEPENEPADVGGKFTMVLHKANINRSFAKIGHMDPYAIIDVDGTEVGRSKPDKSAHKEPHWESSFSWQSESLPKEIHVAVWDKNNFHRDVFIGAVTVPCSYDMGRQEHRSFTTTKRSEATGTIELTLLFETTSAQPATMERTMERKTTLGMEFDQVVASFGEKGDKGVIVQLEETQIHRKKSFSNPEEDDPQPDKKPQPRLTRQESTSRLMPLMGEWKCVETHGLDAFLKATGVGVFQRKIAGAAKWPGWDYRLDGDSIVFTNHSAIGDLVETFPLSKDYSWKDGHGNPMTCKAVWTESATGGCLVTERTGKIGNYTEERKVDGDRLEFILTHCNGVSWGRAFERKN